MKKSIFLLGILLVCGKGLLAQLEGQARIDSLLRVVQVANDDTNKVNLLNSLCYAYVSIDPNEGVRYGNMALALAVKLNYENGIGEANGLLGINYSVKGDLPVALDHYLKAMKIAEKTGNLIRQAGQLNNIGTLMLDKGEDSTALVYFSRAMEINEKTGNRSWLANNLTNIGSIFSGQKDHLKALDYYRKALTIKEEIGHQAGIAVNLGNIATSYGNTGDYAKALEYSNRSMEIYKALNDASGISRNLSVIANTYSHIAMDTNGGYLLKLFNGDRKAALREAERNIRQSIEIDMEIEELDALKEDSRLLSEILDSLGDVRGAFESYKVYSTMKDSLFNMEKDKKITEATMQYEFDKKEAKAKAEQERKDLQQRTIRNSIAAGLAGALIFLVVVYRQRNKIKSGKKRSDELLLNILPEEVADELKLKGSADAKQFDEVTVMFTDFKGFTKISEKLSPAQLVAEIDYCFKAFDEIITRHNIEKIKTIGDSYMCVGGLPAANDTHARDVVLAALEIQQFMEQYVQQRSREGKEVFEIRIGIHSGPVVAGIVGVKKFAYDIWGDTVNIASRMESSGEAGKINISGSTYELVKENFNCTHRGKITAKNKGEIDMYFVNNSVSKG